MAQLMPTVIKVKNNRKAAKQKLTAHLQLVHLANPIYKALNDSFVFNLSLEIANTYNLCSFVDNKITEELTSSRLRQQVLYLETKDTRYEIARFLDESHKQIYRLSIVMEPNLKDNNFFSLQK
jgi:hypothetical protein